jgi:transposase
VGQPRFRSKHGRQSIRLTRNGFALHGTRLYVAKVGQVRVRWSRELPSVPSSVTIIREPDGRFYASFVVERDSSPLPAVTRTAGIDLGLISFEDLAVAGLARTRLAKNVHDAGWGTFLRLLQAKAAQHGRQVVRVGRWEPTSQTCSACGHRDGPKPLGVRVWACPACRAVHDRDGNAARNILVTAGLAETQTACGGHVRPGVTLAVASEAGTHRGAV